MHTLAQRASLARYVLHLPGRPPRPYGSYATLASRLARMPAGQPYYVATPTGTLLWGYSLMGHYRGPGYLTP